MDEKTRKVLEEYVIHIGMTPHPWDNKDEPYWWSIIKNGCNEGFGWSKTPEQAWKDANKYHEKYHSSLKERFGGNYGSVD